MSDYLTGPPNMPEFCCEFSTAPTINFFPGFYVRKKKKKTERK